MWQQIQAGPLIRPSRNSAWMFMNAKCYDSGSRATWVTPPVTPCIIIKILSSLFLVPLQNKIFEEYSPHSLARYLSKGKKKMSGTIGRPALNPIGLKPLGHLMTFIRHSIPCRFGFPCPLVHCRYASLMWKQWVILPRVNFIRCPMGSCGYQIDHCAVGARLGQCWVELHHGTFWGML